MNSNPKISIIVPVYNVEQYLPRCIDSILNQSFADFELLLIDDGSKDKSGAICDEYTAKDSRIRVFHKENGGVSSARNLGLDNSKGDYITFVDADDYLLPNTIKSKTIDGNYDLILLRRIPKSYFTHYKRNLECSKISGYKIINAFYYEIWGRIYRKNIIDNIRFKTSLAIGEDLEFVIKVLDNVKSLKISVETGGYYYYNNENSVMHNSEDVDKDCSTLISEIHNYYLNNPNSLTAMFTLLMYHVQYRKKKGLYYNYINTIPIRHILFLPIRKKVKIDTLWYTLYFKILNMLTYLI